MGDSSLRDYWRKLYSFVDVTTVGGAYDPVHRDAALVMVGSAHMDWTEGWYETDSLGDVAISFERIGMSRRCLPSPMPPVSPA